MNRAILFIGALLLAAVLGFLAGRQTPVAGPDGESRTGGERKVLYWVAPMDPNYRRDAPGRSPMGMDLIPVYADQVEMRAGAVRIDPTVVGNLGVRSEAAEFGPLSRRIETVGHVTYDEDTLQHVHTRVEGWIEKLATKATGDRVEQGQLLFEFYSPTLVNAQEEYLAAMRSGNAGLRRASRERLSSLGVGDREIASLESSGKPMQRVPVYAEVEGVIAYLGVREGNFVTPSTDIMSVAKLDRIWVFAEVFERQAGWVERGQAAVVTLDYLPSTSLRGTVDYVYPELDAVTRTLKVRLRLDNTDETLRPNMFAKVLIHGRSTGDVVHVARHAVIRGGRVDRVVVDLGGGRYQSRPVSIGVESGDRVAIREGLSAAERVVTSAQFLIDSEASIETALDRMSDDRNDARDDDGAETGP